MPIKSTSVKNFQKLRARRYHTGSKHLLNTHEGLFSYPQTHVKSWVHSGMPVTPVLCGVEGEGLLKLTGC